MTTPTFEQLITIRGKIDQNLPLGQEESFIWEAWRQAHPLPGMETLDRDLLAAHLQFVAGTETALQKCLFRGLE